MKWIMMNIFYNFKMLIFLLGIISCISPKKKKIEDMEKDLKEVLELYVKKFNNPDENDIDKFSLFNVIATEKLLLENFYIDSPLTQLNKKQINIIKELAPRLFGNFKKSIKDIRKNNFLAEREKFKIAIYDAKNKIDKEKNLQINRKASHESHDAS